ncbi:serine/threonine-protein kinase [Streptacidiphilus sp. ASG 303]|uniref:serine/threonine-protein kinase n=1 Tax=Streptacidiphilus sp. ASG 303 TaxID=2896847 RepID=UPI001E384397|nr:serine/threonine-protein kinase [Streptacidiphilus sp. ASG 303]MCD0485992.1 serine/threonine-protein kinase [Streptacidiphilus sp. ASG 303]
MVEIEGRYELTALLGRGGMGEVWSGYDKRLDRPVAVKLMIPRPGDRTAEPRFVREARLTARLEHPGVPVIHDVGTLPDRRLFLVMQLIRGRTLAQLLAAEGRLSADRAARLAVQIAGVLAHAHAHGVVHRDLKPGNLMVAPDGAVKVLDFGIAAALEPDPGLPPLTADRATPGTPGFISPEQALGQRATPRSDLYALGCVLYEALAGEPPFTAPLPMALVYRHANEEPRPLREHRPDLPEGLADLVARLMAKDPDARPASAAEVRALAESWTAEGDGPQAVKAARDAGGPSARPPVPPAVPAPQTVRSAAAVPGPAPDPKRSTELLARTRRLAREGRYSQAAALLQQSLGGRADTRPETVARRLALLGLLVESGELQQAHDGYRELGDRLLASGAAAGTAAGADLLACRAGAARCLAGLGRSAEALAEFRALLPQQRSALGTGSPDVLGTRREIARLLAGTGDLDGARSELAALRDDQDRLLPPGDPAHREVAALLDRVERLVRVVRPRS